MSFRLDSNVPAALALLAASLLAPQAGAQAPASASAASPAHPAAPPPYRSALEGYQRYTDEKIANWKEANDTAARIGGWREYARQAQDQAREGAAPSASSPALVKP